MSETSTKPPDEVTADAPATESTEPTDEAMDKPTDEAKDEATDEAKGEDETPQQPESTSDKPKKPDKPDKGEPDGEGKGEGKGDGKGDGDPRRRLSIPIPVVKVTDPLIATMSLLVLVAALAAAWFGWGWHTAKADNAPVVAAARDEALRSGQQAIANLNTLDYRNLDPGLKVWQDSSTGELYSHIVGGRQTFVAEMTKNKTITAGKILQAAVTELDVPAGKATIIAAVQVTLTRATGAPSVKTSRQIGRLTRTTEGWKLSELGTPPVSGT